MENSAFNNNDEIINSMTESLLNNQFDESPQSLNQEEMSTNIQDNQITKEDKIGKIEFPKSMKTTKIQKNLDDYIQNCLNKYKPVEKPDPSLYQNTTEQERDFIISRKSTIPDLVIWNKTFNKNECFYEANTDIQNDFPRYRFYLRLGNKDKSGKNKNEKNKNEKKKNKKKNKNKNNNANNGEDKKEGNILDNIVKKINNLSINNDKKDNNMNNPNANNENKTKKEKKKKNKNKENKNNDNQNKFNINPNNNINNKYDNINNINNNNLYAQKKSFDNIIHNTNNQQMNNFLLNNKFSMPYNNNIGIGNNNYNMNNNRVFPNENNENKGEAVDQNIMFSLIKDYLIEPKWIIITNNGQSGVFNSINLYNFLINPQNKLYINMIYVIPFSQKFKVTGEIMLLNLAKFLPLILNNNQESQYNKNYNNNMMNYGININNNNNMTNNN